MPQKITELRGATKKDCLVDRSLLDADVKYSPVGLFTFQHDPYLKRQSHPALPFILGGDQNEWSEQPPGRHDIGDGVLFADGHDVDSGAHFFFFYAPDHAPGDLDAF